MKPKTAKRTKILINALPMKKRGVGGGDTYLINLIKALADQKQEIDYEIHCIGSVADRFPEWPGIKFVKYGNFGEIPFLRFIYEQTVLPIKIFFSRPDIVFMPLSFGVLFCPARSLLVIHDLLFAFNKVSATSWRKNLIKKLFLPIAIRRATKIVALTEAIKQALIEHYSIELAKIITVHSGIDQTCPDAPADLIAQMKKKYGLDFPYIYYPATFYRHKNHLRLLKVFAKYSKEVSSKLLLVFTGLEKRQCKTEIDNCIRDLNIGQNVKYLGFVPKKDILLLYSGAVFSVFPTLYEGFGFPVLESMLCQCPVLASNIEVVSEIAGDAALYCDPMNEESIYRGFKKMFEDSELRKELVERGSKRVRQFSWEKTAGRYCEIFQNWR